MTVKFWHEGRYWTPEEVEEEGERLNKWLADRQAARDAQRIANDAGIGLLTFKDAGSTMTVRGIATSQRKDRMGDVVEPDGAVYSLPVPFLMAHDATAPLGEVNSIKRAGAGLEIVGTIQRGLSARIDEGANLIRAGLYRGLSIGFRGLETERIKDGVRFLKWELLEISAVTIPANPDGRIVSAKHWNFAPTDLAKIPEKVLRK